MVQTILPRYSHPFAGVDYGGKRRLIAATPDKRVMLFVVEGHYAATTGVRGFGRSYQPARLALLGPSDSLSATLAEGRISKATLVRHREVIDKAFGARVALDLDPRKTQWVTPQGLVELK